MATDTAPLPVSAPPRRLWQLPTFVLGLVAVWAAATYVTPPPDPSTKLSSKLDDLAVALDRKPLDPVEVEPLVKLLADSSNPSPRTHYLLGSAYVGLALLKPTESTDLWKLAQQHFEACDAAGLKPEDAARMAFRSAKALAAVGKGEPKALIVALMNSPPGEDRSECPRLLAESALRLPQPDLTRARDELTNYLSGPNRSSATAADRYKLKLAELNLALNDSERARRWLKDISSSAPADVLANAKMTLARQAYAEKNWAEAVNLLSAAEAIPGLPSREKNAIRFQIGESLTKMGNGVQAVPYFEQAAKEPGAIGGQAALKLAEYRGLDPTSAGKRGPAIEWFEKAAANLPTASVTREDRLAAERIIRVCLAESDYANAHRAAVAYGRIAAKDADLALKAEINAAWADSLLKSKDTTAAAKSREAANDFVALAAKVPEVKVKALQRAVPLYRLAGDSSAALQTVSTLLKTDALEPTVTAAMYLEKAELLPSSDFNGIKDSLEKAMSQPGPTAATARLKLALLHINREADLRTVQQSDPTAVETAIKIGAFGRDLLRQVADSSNVTAENRGQHEQALFELGRLNLRDAQYTEAEANFKKQLNLYPAGGYAGYGRLWLVCSLLQQARGRNNDRKLLEEALGFLKPLSDSLDPYLRTYGEIWTANTMLELGDAAAVVPMARDLMTKYRGKPEELVAGKLLFYAYLKQPTPEPAESSRALDRMEQAFAALPKTAYPNDPEYSYDRWKAELPKLRDELRKFTP